VSPCSSRAFPHSVSFIPFPAGAFHHNGNISDQQTELTMDCVYSRGQHEHPAQGYHRHRPRRARQPLGPGLYPRQPRSLLHRARHAQVRSSLSSITIRRPIRPLPTLRARDRKVGGQGKARQCRENRLIIQRENLGMLPCSGVATPEAEVSVWPEVARPSAGRARAVVVADKTREW